MQFIYHFMKTERASAVVLFLALILALLCANVQQLQTNYALLFSPLVKLGINDGLMAVFFFLVGLELKHEFLAGALQTKAQAMLPAMAAVFGMAVPALFYWTHTHHDPSLWRGWAIPAATDIAFALGVLGLMGSRMPAGLKTLLMAIAVLDDLGAIVVIALFYTAQIFVPALWAAAVVWAAMLWLNRRGVCAMWVYALLGLILWACVFKSGVHATIAGVLTALAVPHTQLKPSIKKLHGVVAFGIMPLFALANANLDLSGFSVQALGQPVPWGIVAGLFMGKPLGVALGVCLALALKWGELPYGVRLKHVLPLGLLCGIGFTMALFIGHLAFIDMPIFEQQVKLGIIVASGLSAFSALLVMQFLSYRAHRNR
jgi:NhaA family Na+:H+ antiporter